MGRVYRRNGHWYLDYKDRNGRRVRRMVPDAEARTQRQAKGLLADLEADELRVAREIRRGVYDARTNHVEIGPLLESCLLHTAATKRYETARAWRSALAATVGGFVRDVVGSESKAWPPRHETSLDKLRCMQRRFVCGPLGVEFVDELTPARIENWVSAGRSAYQGRTLVLRVKVLEALLTWAAKEGRIRSSPLAARGKSRCFALDSRITVLYVSSRNVVYEEIITWPWANGSRKISLCCGCPRRTCPHRRAIRSTSS